MCDCYVYEIARYAGDWNRDPRYIITYGKLGQLKKTTESNLDFRKECRLCPDFIKLLNSNSNTDEYYNRFWNNMSNSDKLLGVNAPPININNLTLKWYPAIPFVDNNFAKYGNTPFNQLHFQLSGVLFSVGGIPTYVSLLDYYIEKTQYLISICDDLTNQYKSLPNFYSNFIFDYNHVDINLNNTNYTSIWKSNVKLARELVFNAKIIFQLI